MIAITAPSPSPPASSAAQEVASTPVTGILNAEEEAAIALSRNTSVISTRSSSSSSSSSIAPPPRPRPIRTYTGPQAKNVPDVLPASPTTPKATQRNFDDYLLAGAAGVTPPRNGTPTTDAPAACSTSIEAQMANAIAIGSGLHVPGAAFCSAFSSGFNTPTRISPTPGHSTPNGVRSRQPSGSNNAQNYRFEGVLGEGSYSTVRILLTSIASRNCSAC
jgi:hypothetical protein